jgi:16S rRNA (guanine527-N7)-methyltransferase
MIAAHLDMVMQARGRMNLISDGSARDALSVHVADSLAAAPHLEDAHTLVDIGSGAGYPGIPLAAALRAEAWLVESRGRRAAFLQSVVDALQADGFVGHVLNERAESLSAIEAASPAQAVVARAVASLSTLVELAAPYVARGGLFVAFKGRVDDAELERGDSAAAIVGLGDREVIELSLPGGQAHRELVMYRRVGDPSVDLPRREGRASKSPLA